MIDLTPLDVRNKRGDFKKLMRGYDPHEVDVFLELAAERLEALVRENMQLKQRMQTLQEQVSAQSDREQAVQDALVTAQELRADIRAQSQREADLVAKEAEAESRRIVAEAEAEARRMIGEAEAEVRSRLRGIERQLDHAGDTIQELERRRVRFLKEFRGLLERELDVVEVEEDRVPFAERAIDMELGPGRHAARPSREPPAQPPAAGMDTRPTEVDTPPTEGGTPPTGGDTPPTEGDTTPLAGGGAPSSSDSPPEREAEEGPAPSASHTTGGGNEPPGSGPGGAIDVPEPKGPGPTRRSAPPAAVGDEPSSLELELMAGAETERASDPASRRFEGVPDLETVLAEAGIEEVRPPADDEISPPPPQRPSSGVIFFDPEDEDR